MTKTLEALTPDVRVIADSLAVQWPGIEAGDIYQEMMVVMAKRFPKVKGESARKIALGVAKRTGLAYCAKERQYYQAQTAEWIYTPDEVRALLAEFYCTDAWMDAPKKPDIGNQSVTGDGISVALMDMRTAVAALPERDQSIILSVYHQGETLGNSGERMRLSRAVDRIVHTLNRQVSQRFSANDHDGPGSRTAVSNARARAMTTYDYE